MQNTLMVRFTDFASYSSSLCLCVSDATVHEADVDVISAAAKQALKTMNRSSTAM